MKELVINAIYWCSLILLTYFRSITSVDYKPLTLKQFQQLYLFSFLFFRIKLTKSSITMYVIDSFILAKSKELYFKKNSISIFLGQEKVEKNSLKNLLQWHFTF